MAEMSNENNFTNWSLTNLQKLNVQDLYIRQRQSLRPWFEFFNTTKFKPPANFGTATRRLITNIEYFQTNYFIIIIILSIYCVVTTPSLLFILLAIIAGCYLVSIKNRDRQVTIMGRQIPLPHQYLAVICLCIPLLIMVGAGSAIFWILGASVFVIVLHAIFHQTPNQDSFGLQMQEV
ncbi:unnamed protein product [Rotaria sp. Silwood2]|nr:unnamed protein product [Rotaria sp. Silwood2]CAF2665380.1 unnamed protein product [Rotaria sp. Silwood2]CAF3081769.1 unnamed protein product [Rotaria sp. Silwood2]CAF3878307.1 unnamed protein product [Rotaria sp. Silwood2]CAF3946193.1 unnamed protein product [Rotaria sp. Silwood2]